MTPGRDAASVFGGAGAVPLLTAAQMAEWDRRAVEEAGVPERLLMEAAGRSVAAVVQQLYPRGRVAAAVGRGNNGGDALIALRCLAAWGREVVAVPIEDAPLRGELLHGWRIPVEKSSDAEQCFARSSLVLDGLLGTGASGAPRGPAARLIRAMRAAGTPVLALDIPSGVDPTSGSVPGEVLSAEVTVAFGALKRGLLRFPGRQHCGRILVAEVGFPPVPAELAEAALITPGWAVSRLPAVPPDAHKGTMGTVVLVAGRSGMAGAAVMAATAAARAGAGLIRVVSAEANRTTIQSVLPEAIFTDRDSADVEQALRSADAVLVGPGIGTDEDAAAALRTVLETGEAPVVCDADGLNLLARDADLRKAAAERELLLTPHPGELGRLLGCSTEEVTDDPFSSAAKAAERFESVVLLKGHPSLVAARGQQTLANITGHSGLATGGTGDTLAGICAGLLAQTHDPRMAAALALFYGGLAAEMAGRGRGLLPRDVAEAVPAALPATQSAGRSFPGIIADLPAAR